MSGNRRFVEFLKFNAVGLLNTAVDFVVYTGLLGAGVHLLAAQTAGYGCGIVNSYLWNKYWTFRRGGVNRAGESGGSGGSLAGPGERARFARFVALNIGTLLLSLLVLWLAHDGIGLHPLAAKAAATAVTMVANYAGSRLWVFR
jgi:putative flippase GtrA